MDQLVQVYWCPRHGFGGTRLGGRGGTRAPCLSAVSIAPMPREEGGGGPQLLRFDNLRRAVASAILVQSLDTRRGSLSEGDVVERRKPARLADGVDEHPGVEIEAVERGQRRQGDHVLEANAVLVRDAQQVPRGCLDRLAPR